METKHRLSRGRPRWGVAAVIGVAVAVGWLQMADVTRAASASAGVEVVSADGPVQIGTPDPEQWRSVRVGDRLAPGETVRTSWGGRVELALGSSRVRLYENSSFRVPDDLQPTDERAVHLDSGAALFDVLLGGDVRRFEVHTPEAVAAVRGTRFGVRAEPGQVALLVYEGSVALDSAERPGVLVHAGFGATGLGDDPFEITVLEDADPWEAWSGAGAALPRIGPAETLGDAAARAAQRVVASVRPGTPRRRVDSLAGPAKLALNAVGVLDSEDWEGDKGLFEATGSASGAFGEEAGLDTGSVFGELSGGDPVGDFGDAGGLDPVGDFGDAGGLDPVGDFGDAGGLDPVGDFGDAGGLDPVGDFGDAGGLDPVGDFGDAGGLDPVGDFGDAGGLDPVGDFGDAGGLDPGGAISNLPGAGGLVN